MKTVVGLGYYLRTSNARVVNIVCYRTRNLEEKHGLLEANHCASGRGSGGVTLSYICPRCNSFFSGGLFGGYRLEGSIAVGGVQSVEKDMNGEHPTGFWWCRLAQPKMKRRFSGHMRSRKDFVRPCENLINALKLLANQQKDGDSPIQNIVMGLTGNVLRMG